MTALRAAGQERFLVGLVHWTVRGIILSNTGQSRSEAAFARTAAVTAWLTARGAHCDARVAVRSTDTDRAGVSALVATVTVVGAVGPVLPATASVVLLSCCRPEEETPARDQPKGVCILLRTTAPIDREESRPCCCRLRPFPGGKR